MRAWSVSTRIVVATAAALPASTRGHARSRGRRSARDRLVRREGVLYRGRDPVRATPARSARPGIAGHKKQRHGEQAGRVGLLIV